MTLFEDTTFFASSVFTSSFLVTVFRNSGHDLEFLG